MDTRRVIAFALLMAVCIAALAGPQSLRKAHAQVDQGSNETVSPLRLILSGPPSSTGDQVIHYRLEYDRVNDNAPTGGLVFVYSVKATLVGIRGVEGPAPTDLGQHAQDSEQFGVEGDHGIVEFDVQPLPGFAGELDVGIYIIGTGIELPEGSVTNVTTNVTPHTMLPSTGSAGRAGTSRYEMLPVAAIVLLIVGWAAMTPAALRARSR
jgi:hypothetical protein